MIQFVQHRQMKRFVLLLVSMLLAVGSLHAEITSISAGKDQITIAGHGSDGSVGIAELQPYQSTNDLADAPQVAQMSRARNFKIRIPRWDGPRDRLYSGFLTFAVTNESRLPEGEIHFVETMRGIAKYNEPFPHVASKKGLQVQMIDDAIALGVKHAGLNFNVAAMIDLSDDTNSFIWESDGVTYHFKRYIIEDLDRRTKPLSDAGMVITFILLNYQSGDPAINRITLHPHYSTNAPAHLSAFNTLTPDGLRYFKACMEFLADRYSKPPYAHGCAVNFIVGNEVNSHWQWCNLGEADMKTFADDYLKTVRVCNTAIHKFNSDSRVYICLEHHWNMRGDTPLRSFNGRDFIDYFNERARAQGNFDWNLAFHPYPEDLNEPRTWNDKTATLTDNTPRITFKNLQMLPQYFHRPELLYHGHQRHIILSEQGFNTPKNPNGQLWQATAYCYAYYKVAHLPGIDSFILNRHVDNREEFGLNLGLWTRKKGSIADPATKKMIYEVFRLADTPQWRQAFAFALPVIGISDWKDLDASNPAHH
jgi:hypothetical protein